MQSQTQYFVTCALVALVLVVTLTEDVQALTAFGKSQPADKDTKPTPKVPKGRVCTTDSDCLGTPSTSCTLSATDGKKHCLCRDGTPPINSKCAIVPKEPGKLCGQHSDCVLNAECVVANETRKKTCTCKDGFDWDSEIDDTSCSGSGAVWPCVITLFITFLVLAVTEPRAHSMSS